MRFVEKSLSQHGQPAFVLEGEGGGRFIAKNLVCTEKVVSLQMDERRRIKLRLLSAFIYIKYSHRLM